VNAPSRRRKRSVVCSMTPSVLVLSCPVAAVAPQEVIPPSTFEASRFFSSGGLPQADVSVCPEAVSRCEYSEGGGLAR